MTMTKFLDPKNDFAFKQIFGQEKNKDILIHFINDILGFANERQVKTVSFLKPSQDPEISSKKQSILDVLCTDQDGRQYIVEMQVAKAPGFEQRAQYYAAKAYSRQLDSAKQYTALKEVIFVAITDFVMFPDKKEYKSDHVILDKVTYSHDLKDFYFVFLELPKFTKNMHELTNMVEKWAYFFKHAETTNEKDLSEIAGHDEIIERAYEELNRFSWTDQELFTYEHEEKVDRDNAAVLAYALEEAEAIGEARGEARGKAEGEELAALRIAKQMLANGMPAEQVSQMTQLPLSKIKML